MYAIVGLGNVGDKYKNSRHNVGFLFVDDLKQSLKSKNIIFLKPDTMMNSSGIAVKKLVVSKKLDLSNLYVVHDDLDMKLGEYKIQFGKGPKIHNGINSVERELGTADFWRVRIGVDNRDPEKRTRGEEYVLQDFSTHEKEIVEKVIKKSSGELLEKLNG